MPRKKTKKSQDILNKIEQWDNAWHDNKNDYDDYVQFIKGNQWLDEEARVFETYKKIPLTFNKISPLANHLIGEQRQNTPSLECIPGDDVPVETAEVREALIDSITFNSAAKEVYQTAFQQAILGGYGCMYLDTKYENENTFNQEMTINRLDMPNRAFWDISALSPCKTDGNFCGFKTRMSRKRFAAIYGKDIEEQIPPSDIEEGSVFNDNDSVTIITYWERKYKRGKIYQLSNDRVVTDRELKMLERIMDDEGHEVLLDGAELVTIVNDRDVANYSVKKYLFAGEWELEASDFCTEQLPLIFVDQDSFYTKEGKQRTRSFFKDTKDAQRYINYLGTQSAYLVKIGRYDQFLLSKENVRSGDTQAIWRDPTNVQGGLTFDESKSGVVPTQLNPPELSQSLVQQYERAERDIQTCTGMYNTMTGDQGNETSKLAIDARTKRGSYNTYIPFDNLNRAIAVMGQLINEGIPKIYDNPRTMMLDMKERGVEPVQINQPMDDYSSQIKNDMTQGNYTVRLVPGPSFEGQKQESLDSMQLILQANPQLFNLMADLYVENLPLANNLELRNRLKTIVPPEIIEAGKTGQPVPPKPQPPDPMVQIKMQELQLKQAQLQQQQKKLQQESQMNEQEMAMKWQEIEMQRQQAAAQLQEMELRYLAEAGRTQSDIGIAHANNLVKLLTHGASLDSQHKLARSDTKNEHETKH